MGTLYGPNDARVYDALGDWGVGVHTRSAIRTIANTPNGLVILGSWFLDVLYTLERMEEEYIEEPLHNYCWPDDTLQSVINRVARNGGDWTR
jgi:hypothetical protein